jgi:tetratricopeptide (TPR) repeat protein
VVERHGHTKDPNGKHYVARTCVLAPDAGADLTRITRLAEEAAAAFPQHASYCNVLALAHYRAGHPDEAIRWARAALESEQQGCPWEGNSALSWLVLALAHHRLGQADEARAWLDKAVRWMEENKERPAANARGACYWWGNHLERQLLRREAEKQIRR